MLNGQYDKVVTTRFSINEQTTEGIFYILLFYGVIAVAIGLTVFLVLRAIKKRLLHRAHTKKTAKKEKRNLRRKKKFISGQQEETGDLIGYNDK